MKKLIVYLLYYIGDIACRIGYIRVFKKQFLFDYKLLSWLGTIFYNIYSYCMLKSDRLQFKWNINGPWKDFKMYCQSYIEEDYKDCCEEQCEHCKIYYKYIQE